MLPRIANLLLFVLILTAPRTKADIPPEGARNPGGEVPSWEVRWGLRAQGSAEARNENNHLRVTDAGFGVARLETFGRNRIRASATYHQVILQADNVDEATLWRNLDNEYERLGFSVFWLRPGRWTLTSLLAVEAAHQVDMSLTAGRRPSGLVAMQRRLSDNLTLGGGILATYRLGKGPLVVPVPVIEYRWAEYWTLYTERGVGVRYQPSESTEFFTEISFDFHQYRLPESELAEEKILAHRQFNTQIGWRRRINKRLSATLHVGSVVWEEFAVKDDDARTLLRIRTNPTWLLGVQLGLRL